MHDLMNAFAGIPSKGMVAAAADSAQALSSQEISAFIIGFLIGLLIILALFVLIIASWWRIFKKAGQPGWVALVPIYNTVKTLELTNRPLWWIILTFVPVVNIVIAIMILRRVAGVFGKGAWFTVGLIFLPFIFYPIIAFGHSTYNNTYQSPQPMNQVTMWALIGAVIWLVMWQSQSASFSGLSSAAFRMHPLTAISGASGYVTDGQNVYYDDAIIPGADPTTFATRGDYAVDDVAVYYEGSPVQNAVPAMFTVLGQGAYAVSGQDVYFDGVTVTGANRSTFVELSYDYAKDNQHVYYDGDVVDGADPGTFALVDGSDKNPAYDAKDKTHLYDAGTIAK